jgi:uncharacterized membrane protein YedE/YeeE
MNAAKIAFVVAIPIEIANFLLAGFPLDTGFEPADPWYDKVIAYQWLVLHFPGVMLVRLLDGTGLGKQLVARIKWMSPETLYGSVLFVSGYLDTILLVLVGMLAFRWWVRRHSPGPNGANSQGLRS